MSKNTGVVRRTKRVPGKVIRIKEQPKKASGEIGRSQPREYYKKQNKNDSKKPTKCTEK